MSILKKHLPLLFLIITSNVLWAQIPYLENFTGQVDKGVVGPTPTYDVSGTGWTLDYSAATLTTADMYAKVNASGVFEAKDIDGIVIWTSPSIDISSADFVDLSVDVYEDGDSEATDYIEVYYVVDAGSETLFSVNGENTGDFTSATATQKYIAGSTLQVVVKMMNNASDEIHQFDNVSVAAQTYNAPAVGDVYITEYARYTTADHSYLELYNNTATDIDLSTSKIVSVGYNNEVLDFGTDITHDDLYIPANSFLILNRNGVRATFESNWGVSLPASVVYIQTGQNAFGNNNTFKLRLGGTADTDDGTLIDETTINASALGKRVFQLPAGSWTNNEDVHTTATPGSFSESDNLTTINLVYSNGTWSSNMGYAHSAPSASTTDATAVILSGQAPMANGTVLDKLYIAADAGVDLSTETVTVTTTLNVMHNASLSITSTGSLTCSGSIIVDKVGHDQPTDYNVWGTPFSSTLAVQDVFHDHLNCDFYVFEASSQTWKYDETIGDDLNCDGNIHPVTASMVLSGAEGTADGNFDIGRGYFIPGHGSNEHDFTVASGGVLNNGDISVNIYGSSGTVLDGSNDWNLISNPYPSSISVEDFLTENTASEIITNAVYLYNPGSGMNTASSYNTYNHTHTTNYIASCQGFYVNADTTKDGFISTINFKNSMRHHTNNDFRSFRSFEGVYLDVVDTTGENDPMRLYFDEGAEDGFDRKYDALKLMNGDFNFCSKIDAMKLVFNGMPKLDNTTTKIIPLYFQTNQSSIYAIKLDELVGDFGNRDVLLEDRELNIFHDLKEKDYSFPAKEEEWASRFYLHIIPLGVTGIKNVSDSDLKVFVANKEIVVNSSTNMDGISEIQVINTKGQVISNTIGNGSVMRISTEGYATGVYMVRTILNNKDVLVNQVVIQ